MRFAFRKHKGLVRERQEDSLIHWPKSSANGSGSLFVVADGLGGLPEGHVASGTAVKVLSQLVKPKGFKSPADLQQAVTAAHESIGELNHARDIDSYMATTLTAAYVSGQKLWTAHVGDCRLYRLRDSRLRQLTDDHSIDRHTLARALGFPGDFSVDGKQFRVRESDRLLVCSDGLYGMVPDKDLAEILSAVQTPDEIADVLLKRALDAGGHDNITFYVIEVESTDAGS